MRMREDLRERCLRLAQCVVQEGDTVREAAKRVGVSKSLAHRELTERLRRVDVHLFYRVRKVLLYHKAVRHLRGGEATKRRFAAEKIRKVGNDGT